MSTWEKFAKYWEELGKPQLEYCFIEEMNGCWFWKDVSENNPSWDDICYYRIAGDRHWELRKKWVDSGNTLHCKSGGGDK